MEPIEMRTHRRSLDDSTADRLAAGELHPHDAPPGYAGVARLLTDAAHGPAVADIDAELLGAMVRAIQASPDHVRTPSMISKLRSAKVATAAVALVFATTGAAAAATGSLPDPAQDAVSGVVSRVGLDLPTGGDDRPTAGDDRPTTDDDDRPTTDDDRPTGPADNPTDADAHGAAVSDVARTTEATGADKGAAVSDAARAGHGHGDDAAEESESETEADDDSTDEGRPADPGSQAPVETPNAGGTATADAASGGRSSVGTDIADAASGGRSNAGSANGVDHPTADDNPGSSRRP